MNSARWTEISELLEAALEVPEAGRQAWLEERTGGDLELRREVESLLRAGEGAEDRLRSIEVPRDPSGGREERWAGLRIGAWELEELIGEGGMGLVFRARRVDGEFEQLGALKLVRIGMDNRKILERFRLERQVLASLEHPGIARLLDGGTGPDGRPYLVMELVEGRRIDRFVEEEELDLRATLELFVRVARAVECAHHSLIVHRDLKPANVLVTDRGDPKLLDFGLAQLLDRDTVDRNLTRGRDLTRTGERLLTPHYASPEQVRGGPVQAATDVYAMGVLLYELLSRRRPYELDSTTWGEVERLVCEQPPPPPSRAAGKAGFGQRARALAGDLDAIVMTAVRKEPERRYASAAGFAEDVERYLAGLPVHARPEGWLYRCRRYTRRNALAIAAVATILTVLSVGLFTTYRQYRRAEGRAIELAATGIELEGQKALAQERFERMRGLATDLVFKVHDQFIELPGSTRARELVVDHGLEMLERLAADTEGDSRLELELAAAWLRMGVILGNVTDHSLGRCDEALVLFQRANEHAQRRLADVPDDVEAARLLTRTEVYIGDSLGVLGADEAAREWFERALASGLARARSAEPDTREVVTVAMAADRLMADHLLHARLDEAEARLDLGRELMGGLMTREPDQLAHLVESTTLDWREAQLLEARGDFEGARAALERARVALFTLISEARGGLRCATLLAQWHIELARFHLRQDEPELARGLLERIEGVVEKLSKEHGDSIKTLETEVMFRASLARARGALGETEASMRDLASSLELVEALLDRSGKTRSKLLCTARVQCDAAELAFADGPHGGDRFEVEAVCEQLDAIREQLPDELELMRLQAAVELVAARVALREAAAEPESAERARARASVHLGLAREALQPLVEAGWTLARDRELLGEVGVLEAGLPAELGQR